MRRLMAMVLVMLMAALPAMADKARGIETTDDAAYHAGHLLHHLNGVTCHVTGNYIKVRAEAKSNAKVVGHVEQADEFVLLELDGDFAYIRVLNAHETSPDSWYGLEGWVTAAYVDCPCTEDEYRTSSVASGVLIAGYFPIGMPSGWCFCSGAGAWSTELTIQEDGSFTGYYHDWDAGGDDAYPHGMLQECFFAGCFSSAERISDYEYLMTVERIWQEGTPGDTFVRDGMLVTVSHPYGIGQGDSFTIYLPGAPLNRIPPAYHEWAGVRDDEWQTLAFALYNMTDAYGWNEN